MNLGFRGAVTNAYGPTLLWTRESEHTTEKLKAQALRSLSRCGEWEAQEWGTCVTHQPYAPYLSLGGNNSNRYVVGTGGEAVFPGAPTVIEPPEENGSVRAEPISLAFDPSTTRNFSPQLGETATLKLKLFASGTIGNLVLRVEIGRELLGGGWQAVQSIDPIPETTNREYARPLNFTELSLSWNGIPSPQYDSNTPAAEGPDVFEGINGSMHRPLPAVTAGKCVPPPLYCVSVRVLDATTGDLVSEIRRPICVPQVVRMEYADDAVTQLKQQHPLPPSTNVWAEAMSDAQWDEIRASLPGMIMAQFGADVNLRVVDSSVPIAEPYATLHMIEGEPGNIGGEATLDFGNLVSSDQGNIRVWGLKQQVTSIHAECVISNMTMQVISPGEEAKAVAKIGSHELGHALGLVAENPWLGGEFGNHNGGAFTSIRIMNAGPYMGAPATDPLDALFGRRGDWGWRSLNTSYLKFILPVPQ